MVAGLGGPKSRRNRSSSLRATRNLRRRRLSRTGPLWRSTLRAMRRTTPRFSAEWSLRARQPSSPNWNKSTQKSGRSARD